ncbi:hypothetical protein LBMAG20_16320 [Methylocystaceae bacterium]|jgi:hypothetical protein|nr:hypothetical protein LBMAG20_16320 [Methylocystaceae bacterium]
MALTQEDGILIHAKALSSRFKKGAAKEAEGYALKLLNSGDNEGHAVWLKVSEQIKKLRKDIKEYKKDDKNIKDKNNS